MTFEIAFFSNPLLLKFIFEGGILSCDRILELARIAIQSEEKTYPDHLICNYFKCYEGKKISELIFEARNKIVDKYEVRCRDDFWVKNDLFLDWMRDTNCLSPTLFYKDFKNQNVKTTIAKADDCSLKYFFDTNKIVETHLHINGTSLFDFFWNEVISKPQEFIFSVVSSGAYRKSWSHFSQACGINDGVSLQKYIVIAVSLRNKIDLYLKDDSDFKKKSLEFIIQDADLSWNTRLNHNISVESEIEFINNFFLKNRRDSEDRDISASFFLTYILIKSAFYKFLVHQNISHGFEQFQHITKNSLRDFYEDKNILTRFSQLHGNRARPDLTHVEGRFSTKNNISKAYKTQKKIIRGYRNYQQLGADEKYNFSMIGHLIKSPSSHLTTKHGFRHENNIKNSDKVSRYQGILNDNLDEFNDFIVGYDVASNELDTPPVHFRDALLRLKKSGKRLTYHTGEDFHHILSGLRSIFESLMYLELNNGDRLGHCTALGIANDIWVRNMPSMLWIPRGEWLDNLICIYFLYRDYGLEVKNISIVKDNILRLGEKVFGIENARIHHYVDAWRFRYFDPFIHIHRKYDFLYSAGGKTFEEIEKQKDKLDESRTLRSLYEAYYTKTDLYDECIDVETVVTFIDIEKYQECISSILVQRNVPVEVMLTSNLQISQYRTYEEHHLFRWLLRDKHPLFPAKVAPRVVLATDNPGIFNTSLQGEYSIVYLVLKYRFLIPDEDVIEILKRIAKSGEEFVFKKASNS